MGSRVSIHVVVVIEFYELIFATVGGSRESMRRNTNEA